MDFLTLNARKYAPTTKNPGLLQSEVARWASDFLRRKINQSLISEILSNKFKQLDLGKFPRG
jgi:Fission yeast centromere protein N-terminal domain